MHKKVIYILGTDSALKNNKQTRSITYSSPYITVVIELEMNILSKLCAGKDNWALVGKSEIPILVEWIEEVALSKEDWKIGVEINHNFWIMEEVKNNSKLNYLPNTHPQSSSSPSNK